MTLPSDTSKRIVICLVFAVVMFGSLLVFWNPASGRGFIRGDAIFLVEGLIFMSVMTFNILYFIARMKRVNPAIVRFVPVVFPVALGAWFYSHSLFQYDFEMSSVMRVLFLCAAASTVMSVVAYLYLKRRQTRDANS